MWVSIDYTRRTSNLNCLSPVHAWKFRYSASCLSLSVQHVFRTRAAPYAALIDLDKKIRQFPIPIHLRSPTQTSEPGCFWSKDSTLAHQQYCVLCERESSEFLSFEKWLLAQHVLDLLLIHRSSFAQAIRAEPMNPLQHKYGQSVVAVYKSAFRLIAGLKGLFDVHPYLCSRQWFFWSGIFSSCVSLYS